MIWAVQNGYVDDVPVNRVKEFQSQVDRVPEHTQGRTAGEDCTGKDDEPRVDHRVKGCG